MARIVVLAAPHPPLLEELGHRVVVVDLPSEDPTATFETDADVVAMALDAAGVDDAVLVGHSLAGQPTRLIQLGAGAK